jgi:hypothetical protein
MEREVEQLQEKLRKYRFLVGRATGRLAVGALALLILEGEARLRKIEQRSERPAEAGAKFEP